MARKQNSAISKLHKEKATPHQNPNRKSVNTHLTNGGRIRSFKSAAVAGSFSANQTERMKKEIGALRQEMEFILGVTRTGLDIIDSNFNIRFIDTEWAKVYGDPTGKKCYEYFMDRNKVCPNCGIPVALKTKRVAVSEETLIKEGNRPIQVTTIPFQDGNGEWLVAEVNVDISERKRAEDALRKANEELEEHVRERTAQLERSNVAMQTQVTEHKRTLERLQKSEERYRNILESIQEGYFETNLDGDYTFANDANAKFLGYTKDELVRMNYRQHSDQETIEKLRTHYTRLYQTGKPIQGLEVESIRKDGSKAIYETSVSLMKDSEGKTIGFRGVSRDITQRKQAEEALQKSEEKYRTILDEMEEGYFETDLAGNLTFINDAGCRNLGYPREELIGINNRAYTDKENAKKVFQAFNEIYRTGQPCITLDYEITRKDGSKAVTELSASLMRDSEGKPVGFRGISRHITERKKMEEALREREEQYRVLLETMEEGYYEVDLAGNLTFVNDSFCRIHTFPKEKMLGMNNREYMSKETARRVYEIFNGVYKTGKPVRLVEWEITKGNGEKAFVEASVYLIRNSRGEPIGFRGIERDITDRKQAEETLRRSEERYRNILESIQEGYSEIDLRGNFTFVNNVTSSHLGYTKEELIGMNYRQYTSDENARKIKKIYTEVYKTGEPIDLTDHELVGKDGTTATYELSVSLIRNAEGNPIGFRQTSRDITQRKKSEDALRHSEEKYRNILERIEEGYYEEDLAGNFTFFNDSMCRIYGYPSEELLGLNYKRYTDKETAKKLFQIFNEIYRTGNPCSGYDYELIRKDGTKRFIEASASLIKDSARKPVGFRGIVRDVTERKKAEDALRQSEERYRTILETMQEAYYELDLPGHFTFVNNALCRHLGYTKKELIGTKSNRYQDETNAKQTYQAFNEIYRTGEPVKALESEYIRKDGTKGTYEMSASLIRDAQGKPIGFRGVSRDVTERKQAEQALRRSEQRYRNILESIQDGYFENDLAGDITFINDIACKHLGYSREELIGLNYRKYTDEENARKLYQNYNAVYRTGQPIKPFEVEYIKKDGTRLVDEISVSLMKDLEGKTIGFRGTSRDVTERKEAEEALRKSEERYRTIIENLQDGYFENDLAGNFIFVNDVICKNLGYTREELIGMNYRQYTEEEGRKNLLQHYGELYRTEQPIKPFEAAYIRKDGGKLLAEISVSLIRDSEGKPIGFRGISHDITERKQAEEEKLSLQEQLRQSQKMEAIGQLAGGVAHDFNNLLTVIKGYSQLSLLDLKEDAPLRGNIQEIEKATQRATDLTRQLLAFSRRQILDLKVLDLNTLLNDLEKMLRRIIGEDIELVTLLSEDLGKVKVDPSQIEQVIFNLAVNARDAMPAGGRLAIETANVELDEEYAHAHVSVTPGRYVRLSVSDTGVGMTQEVKEKVFEPFFTTKEKGKGTGLGLSMVYGIVKQSGGNIWLYSEPGRGTTLRIYFPRTEEEADALHRREDTEFFPRGSETVLLVEDDTLVRDLANRLLEQQGYRVLAAANGQEALHVAKEHLGETIHLLLADIVMPQMGGKELADWLKISRPNIKVLFTSGYADNAIVHHGVLDPGTHFLQKPFSLKTLSNKVREVLDG